MIRPADLGDVPAITAIYRHAVLAETATFELDPPDEAEMGARFRRLVDGGYPYLVSGTPGDVEGYAYAGAYRERPAYRHTVEDSIYLRPDRRGRGIGRVLLDALVAKTEARGFRQLVAVIGDGDNAASIRLHAAAGFTHVGVLAATGWKHERWLDVVLMQRALGAGAARPPT